MLRFKALGEESSGSETDDDPNRNKQTRESLEEDAGHLYHKGLKLLCEAKNEEAALIFEDILDSAYINDDEDKTPMQIQMRKGCLKNLSIIYANSDAHKESAQRVLLEAVSLDPKNVTLWCRLGRIDISLSNYCEAYFAFQQGLKCSPHHWICIENLVTLAFVLGDYISCLYYCGLGLEKDASFIRGAVFRDEIFESSPFVVETCKLSLENWDSLFLATPYDACWKTKYLKEAKDLIEKRREVVTTIRLKKEEEQIDPYVCKDRMKSFTLAELCQSIFDFHKKVIYLGTRAFYRPVDMSAFVRNPELETLGENSADAPEKFDGIDETSRHSLNRGRSGTDEKESVGRDATADKIIVPSTNGNTELQRGMSDEDCSQSQDTQEPEPKKKSRKDVKWWQYEGKRRSQRVRGHLMPISQTPSKNERGFAETLKDLIHSALLYGEPDSNTEEAQKTPVELDSQNYFGSQPEVDDVKKFIFMYGKTRFITVITELAPFLCQLTKHSTWPNKLVTQYLESCKHYRRYRQELNEWMGENDSALSLLRQDALIILSTVEFRLDEATPTTIESLKSNNTFVSDLAYLEIVLTNGLRSDYHLNIRYYWFRVNYELLLAQVGLGLYKFVLHYLHLLETKLMESTKSVFVLKLATKIDNVISLEVVRKKIHFVKKMENISRISELYQNHQYEALIEILQLCLTSEDYSTTDLGNRFYLAESFFFVGKYSDCIAQCVKIVTPCLKSRNEEILSKCLNLIENMCIGDSGILSTIAMKDKRSLTNSMIEILTWNENKGTVSENVLIIPWCVLHSILFNLETQEPVLYLDEDTAPNSVVLLQFAHEFLNRSNKCTICDGKLLTYTVDVLFTVRKNDDHGSYEETKHCIEQAIFCLYSHPSKKSKLKYLTEHCTSGIELQWSRCIQLYEYYKPEDIPEFDSYQSISAETEGLFQRILTTMPSDLKPKEQDYEEMKLVLEGSIKDKPNETNVNFPHQLINIYYLLADHYFKTKDWTKAVEYYTYDLTVIPSRFDSWAAIALAKGEMISSKLNACDNYVMEEVLTNADIVINCFQRALDLEPNNSKIRIEFGSFIYAMHSFCSRLLKGSESLSFDTFQTVESKKETLLRKAINCFEPLAKTTNGLTSTNEDDEDQHELWIHHYLLGKVMEKMDSANPEQFLNQYELAGKLICEQGAPYPAKINFYNPPELAVEALEIYYRIHASILSYVERNEYNETKEIMLAGFIQRAAASPFVKSKQSRGGGASENQERKRKAGEGVKKDQAEIKNLLQDLLKKVEDMISHESNASSSSSSDDDDDGTSVTSSQASTLYSSDEEDKNAQPPSAPVMSSFGLSAFQEKMREKEKAQIAQPIVANKISEESKNGSSKVVGAPLLVQTIASIEQNKFYKDFAKVKYGILISQCLAALEECIVRFPQHHKSYYRISYTYAILAKDSWKISKDYLLGASSTDKKKIAGLFADRKTNNFFNGVWRNPVDDIDRPGSFPYHMARTIQHLLEVLEKLNDHQLLAEVAIALSKVPEQDKQYLYNVERQQFSQQAFSSCVGASKRHFSLAADIKDGAISIFETYQKLQKFNAKENVLGGVLLDCYRQYLEKFGQNPEAASTITLDQAFKFFQHLTWASKTNPGYAKVIAYRNTLQYPMANLIPNLMSHDSVTSDGKMVSGELVGNSKISDLRKRKESVGKQASEKNGQRNSSSNTGWSKGDRNVLEKDPCVPKKKQTSLGEFNVDVGIQSFPCKGTKSSSSGIQRTSGLSAQNSSENRWNTVSSSQSSKPENNVNISSNEPEIIDLSQNRTDGCRLKKRHSAETEYTVDPLCLAPPPKKANINSWSKNYELSKMASEEKSILNINATMGGGKVSTIGTTTTGNKIVTASSSSGSKILSVSNIGGSKALPVSSSGSKTTQVASSRNSKPLPVPAAGESIPFSVFMESFNKSSTKTFESIRETVNKQSQAKRLEPNVGAQISSSTVKYNSANRRVDITTSTKQLHSQESLLIAQTKSPVIRPGNSSSYISTPSGLGHTQAAKEFGDKIASQITAQSSKMPAPTTSKSVPVSVNSFASRNTSPFKAQTTVMTAPSGNPPKKGNQEATPPPAHGRRSRTASEWSSGEEPEIIDLTTPPRKNHTVARPVEASIQSNVQKAAEKYFVPRAVNSKTNYPMPPKKNIQARQRNMSSESSEDPEVIFLD